jgi:membrane-bound lytic murein transglycosylase MltF
VFCSGRPLTIFRLEHFASGAACRRESPTGRDGSLPAHLPDMKKTQYLFAYLLLTCFVASCSSQKQTSSGQSKEQPPAAAGAKSASPPAAAQNADDDNQPPAYESALPEDLRKIVDTTFSGDFDEMVKRRLIRVGAPFNRTFYFIDKGVQRGLSYEYATLFEDALNKKLKTGNLKIHVVLIPMTRDMLLPALQNGKLDLAVAQLTVTPERQKIVDFSNPTRTDVDEVVVTGPGTAPVNSVDELSGRDVFVRKASSYYDSLQTLNQKLQAQSKEPVAIHIASESLEDDDLLEMVNAGLIPITVVDNYIAEFWKKVFTDLNVHDSLMLRAGGNLAVAMRKGSPKLAAELNAFIEKNGLNSTIGRVLNQRYLENTKFVKNAASDAERKKFLAMVQLFEKYGDKYDFDYLLMAAQGYQESRLDQGAKSQVGAVGVMQLMPETGREQKVGDIRQLEPNIHAGVKYMRFVRDEYFKDEPMDDLNKALFTFASYNAGPGRIRQLRRETERRGLNPNIWFGNVERVASERIGRETVTYVSNIYKYYVAYKLLSEERNKRNAAKTALTNGRSK